ncbi:hypothetical protein [Bifidobacterium choerinum]|uniref:Erythrocyte binding protein n=1 Tax=Bifidobacterium choerinum TaxID=35760 RepID=A0A087AIB1_9BIFI|nr:hypothetical protein [Bifidobacterium choerinum]KFI58511.1 erythrocyte binding protein [Bifidobacterium choerinum]
MMDDSTIVYAEAEAGTQTELINPNEIAALAKKPDNNKPPKDDERKYLWVIFASIVVLALFAAVILVGVQIHNHRQQQLAQEHARCESAMTELDKKAKQYEGLRSGDGAAAGAISDIQVADSGTVKLLDEQLKAQAPAATSCAVSSVDQYDARIQQIHDYEEWYDAHMRSLQEAVDGVNDSKQLKEVEEATATLDDTLREAQATLDLTRGQVADEATWNRLSDLYMKAKQAEEGRKLDEITSVEQDIKTAIGDVNASRDKKIADDERKAREDAQKKAQAEADRRKAENQSNRDGDRNTNQNNGGNKENDRR